MAPQMWLEQRVGIVPASVAQHTVQICSGQSQALVDTLQSYSGMPPSSFPGLCP